MDRITVPEIVSAEDLRSYTDNGYLVVENLISDDELREICDDLPRLNHVTKVDDGLLV